MKRLEHRGIRIIGTADGYDTRARGRKVMRIARGLINELYLDDLREKTHRGLAGQFDRGLSAGGRSYGYRTVEAPGGRSMVIDETEAAHVRWIFERFADGHSVRAIAHQLNQWGLRSARGGTWAVSALHGSVARGLGLLNNELYIGHVVWNRRQWLKDPETGKRGYVERPREEWLVRQVPELRIVSAELWQRVRNRTRKGPTAGTRAGRGAVPRTLFSGILRCATCGGPVIAINRERYGCGVHKDRGNTVCNSGVTVTREALDHRLVTELCEDLLQTSALAELQDTVRGLLASPQHQGGTDAAAQRLAMVDAEIRHLVDAVARLGLSDALQRRLQAAETEHRALTARLTARLAEPAPITRDIIDDVTARYRRMMLQLKEVLAGEGDLARTRHILADMLGVVTIGRDDAGVYADLEEPAERLLVAVAGESLGLVARAGFEPATFGL